MRHDSSREETDYRKRVNPLVYHFVDRGVIPDLSLELVCLSRPFDNHWIIARNCHYYPDLDLETRLRWDLALGEVFVGWNNPEAFYF